MEGIITSFRRSRHTLSGNHVIIEVSGYDLDKAKKIVGKEVNYNTGKNIIKGKIASVHGNSGKVRAIFEKGMPGQCLGSKVSINN